MLPHTTQSAHTRARNAPRGHQKPNRYFSSFLLAPSALNVRVVNEFLSSRTPIATDTAHPNCVL